MSVEMATKRKLSLTTSLVPGDAKRIKVGNDDGRKHKKHTQRHRTILNRVCAKPGRATNNAIQHSNKDSLHVVTAKISDNCDAKSVFDHKKAKTMEHRKLCKFNHSKKHKASTTYIHHSGQKTVNDNPKENPSTNKNKQNCVIIPRKPEEISSNWKQLQQSLYPKPKNKIKVKKLDQKNTSENCKQQEISKEPDIWFDDVDEILIEASKTKEKQPDTSTDSWNNNVNPLVKSHSFTGLTKVLAMDCEMVGTGTDGKDSILARVSIVNQYGQCVYDKYVQPTDKVTDYRTQFSGIRPGDMEKGEHFKTVQKEVHDILKGRILVGHAIHNDLKVLFLEHPRKAIRDTSKYKPFRKLVQGRQPSLKKLSDQILGVRVQEGEHNSVQDAQAAMRLYTMYRKQWEKEIKLKKKLRQYKVKLASAKEKPSVKLNVTGKGNLESDTDD